ncbi:MAG: hypothetical protein ACOCV1_05755 [Bacillota bacterium]
MCNKKIDKNDLQEECLITEYVETEEEDGISIIHLNEKEKNIDGKQLIIDNIDNTTE